MKLFHPKRPIYFLFFLKIFILSCGSNDIREEIIENYTSGNIKISARYFSDSNVIEKKFYSESGEIIYFERDSLQYSFFLREYLKGNWIMEKMDVNEEAVFEIKKYNSTVLLTSIKGYADVLSKDTLKAFNLLKIQKNIILPIIKDHDGISLINIMNDMLIISFEDVEQSVNCAIAIQDAVKSLKQIKYKMGIHTGTFFKKNEELFGQDINIAEGMRYISSTGGIVISNIVFDAIKENEEIETMPLDLRYYRSKVNLDRAVKPYGIISNGLPEPSNIPQEIFLQKYKKFALDLSIPPTLYEFSRKKLLIKGPQYNADYKITYLDSSQVEIQGRWVYGKEEEANYRTDRIFRKYNFQAISYNTFQWNGFLKDPEKEEVVLFRRILIPKDENELDTTFVE